MQLAYISFLHKSCCRKTLIECLSLQILMTCCFFDGSPTCVCFSAAWQSVFIRTREAHGPCMIAASFNISKFSMTLNIILSNQGVEKKPTHTRMGISITNDWKNMMTNNDALQGQKYTNGVGAVPRGMAATASDVCSLQMASCTLSAVSSLNTIGTPGDLSVVVRQECWCLRLIHDCTTRLIKNCYMIIKTEI